MTSKWINEKAQLEHLILIDKLSYEEIGRRYGCSGANIKNVARRLGIELPIKRKINPKETFNRKYKYCLNCGAELISYNGSYGKYCGPKCQFEHAHMLAYKKLLDGDESIMRANYSPKAFKKDILKEQGGVCGMKPIWNGKELVFIIDHIDGDASNNRRERSYYRYHKNEINNNKN